MGSRAGAQHLDDQWACPCCLRSNNNGGVTGCQQPAAAQIEIPERKRCRVGGEETTLGLSSVGILTFTKFLEAEGLKGSSPPPSVSEGFRPTLLNQ